MLDLLNFIPKFNNTPNNCFKIISFISTNHCIKISLANIFQQQFTQNLKKIYSIKTIPTELAIFNNSFVYSITSKLRFNGFLTFWSYELLLTVQKWQLCIFDNVPNSRLKKVCMENSNDYEFETLFYIYGTVQRFWKKYRIREIFRIAHFVSKFIPIKEKGTWKLKLSDKHCLAFYRL